MAAFSVCNRRPFQKLLPKVGGLLLAIAVVTGSAPAFSAAPATTNNSVSTPASVQVADLDFHRGEDGSGRLTLKFDGKGASPELRTKNGKVIVDIDKATIPASLQQSLDVVDFATPVQHINATVTGKGVQLVLDTSGSIDALAYQTDNQYVVEVAPKAGKRAVGATTTGKTGDGLAAASSEKSYSGKPVTFNFQDVPVRTVLQLMAEESKLNIVASDTVSGNVTLRLVNVPWDQSLDIVLRAKGLDKRRDGNVIWIAPQQELARFEQETANARIALENSEEIITDYIQINYHSANAIFDALTDSKVTGGGGGGGGGGENNNGFLSPRGRAVADERTNTLMISDVPKKVAEIRELISKIDIPVDQILIEARIVVATDTFARDLGAKFGLGGQHTYGDNTATIGSGATGNASATRGLNVDLSGQTYTDASTLPSLAYTLLGTNFNLDLELSALQTEGRGEVLSNPRIFTVNQREAYIKQGREIGYVTITGGTTGAAATPNVQFKEALLELTVTPTVTNDGRVFLNMLVKKDDLIDTIVLANYGTVPELNRREINTAVLVEDGQTVVIGGVYEFTDRESISKVPFLGDIPFLGNMFKKRGKQKDKAELLIFVTPKIISMRH